MLARVRDGLLAAVLLYAMLAVLYGNIVAQSVVGKIGLLSVGAAVIGLLVWRRAAIIAFAAGAAVHLRVPYGILVCLAVGLTARLVWGLGFPGTLHSDPAFYFQLAGNLAFDGTYGDPEALAFWPPGLPLALVPIFWVFGAALSAVVILNCFAFAATCWLTYDLGRRYFNSASGHLAAWLVAVWPASILYAWVPAKELVAAPLVLGSIHAYLSASEGRSWIAKAAISGACVGAAALVHPSLILLPLIFPLGTSVRGRLTGRTAAIFAVQILFLGLVITPWTIRNAVTLERFVLISTNGGYNLYLGNNPDSTGQWMHVEAVRERFPGDEVARDKLAAAAATRWIVQNPGRFAALSARRVLLYLADDDSGAIWAIKRGHGHAGVAYEIARWASNAWWFLVLLLAYCSIGRSGSLASDIAAAVFLYGVAVAAAVFGHSNHHMLYIGPLIGLAIAGLPVGRAIPDVADRVRIGTWTYGVEPSSLARRTDRVGGVDDRREP